MFKKLRDIPPVILFRGLWKYSAGQHARVILYIAMSATATCVELCVPIPIANLLDSFQTLKGAALLHEVFVSMGIFAFLEIIFWSLHGPSRVMEMNTAFKVRTSYQDVLFRKVTLLPVRWHKDHHSGETIDQLRKATDALKYFSESVFEVVQLTTRFFGSLFILAYFMPFAGLIVLGISVIVVTLVVLFDRILVRQYRTINKRNNEVAASIQDYLGNISTVVSLRLEERVSKEVLSRTEQIFPLSKDNVRLNETKWFITSLFVRFTHVGVLLGYCLIKIHLGQTLLVGTFFALYRYMGQIGDSFYGVTFKYSHLLTQSTAIEGVKHIENSFELEARERPEDRLPAGWKKIEVNELTFSHNEESAEAVQQLRNVTFLLERGKRYAFVGESGSGKSTTLGLIRGLHQVDKVQVRCDGTVLSHGLAAVGRHTTLIPQDPEIFSETIRFNISMGIEAADQRLIEAIRLARFEAVLGRLPKGLDTNIAEKGVNLSGGEKQRLALARGIFFIKESDSQIILLDEPTSSVDSHNERRIYENIINEFPNHCIVSSLHKFHLLDLFDEIVFFDNGAIAERGTLEELLSRNGDFSRLWRNSMQREEVKKLQQAG
jgi:ATP-binding cassette subfamily B protein